MIGNNTFRGARGGIKGVQSLHNLTRYEEEEMTRVVSERTVFYCSNFDLDAADWSRQYHLMKTFAQNLRNKLGRFLAFNLKSS